MSFLRDFDKLGHELASAQSRIFALSAANGIPSYGFIKVFSHMDEVRSLDDLSFPYGVRSETDLYHLCVGKMRNLDWGKTLDTRVMTWIGYFYRSYCYLTGVSSKMAFRRVPPSYLLKVYPAYHTQDIKKAVSLALEEKGEETEPEERLMAILRKTYPKPF